MKVRIVSVWKYFLVMESNLWYIRNRNFSPSGTSTLNYKKETVSSKHELSTMSSRKKLTFAKHLKSVFKKSLIASLPEIFTTPCWKRRMWKSLIFLFCLFGFSYQTFAFMQYYWLYPTVVNVDAINPFHVVQPAITFCSNNRVRRHIYCERNKNSCIFYKDKKLFCSEYPKFCQDEYPAYPAVPNFNGALEDFWNRSSWSKVKEAVPKKNIINVCSKDVDELQLNCSIRSFPFVTKDFKPTFCYTVDSQIQEPDAEDNVYPNTFIFRFGLLTFSHEYFFHSDPVIIYAAVHNRKHLINPFKEGFILKGGYSYKAYVSMTKVIRMPYPYATNCTDYVEMWRKNNGTGPLTELECIEYCKLEKIRSAGLCVDEQITYSHTEELCTVSGKITTTQEIVMLCNAMCQPACEEDEYQTKYDELEFLNRLCNEGDESCKSSFIDLKVFFRNFRLTVRISEPKYRDVELFSYIGGFMGMWLGLSLVSALDFFESLCLVLYYPIKMRNKKSQ